MNNDSKWDFVYRLDLDAEEIELLKAYLLKVEVSEFDQNLPYLIEKISNPKKIKRSIKKKLAADTATAHRQKLVKEKINNAINLLRLENKPITPYQVAKIAGISFNTAQKYMVKK